LNLTHAQIARLRLQSQHLADKPFAKPEQVVQWLGAVQAQDYAGAKWAIAQRTAGATDADIDRAFDDGKILRTHVLRPTWHFVLPADIRWLLKLTVPRITAANVAYNRQLELDDALFKRSNALLAKALRGGRQLTRAELGAVLQRGKIAATGHRLGRIIMHAELAAVVCSGARRDKQLTYALLAERAPQSVTLDRAEALGQLARRYFTSHGPATLRDYAWWSGLAAADARAGLEMVKPELASQVVEGSTYWFAPPSEVAVTSHPSIHLLPNYDEQFVAYRDRTAAVPFALRKKVDPKALAIIGNVVVMNGQMIGSWRRRIEKHGVIIETSLLIKLNKLQRAALQTAVERYARFIGMPVKF
jgi:hypothetical protein